MNEQSQQQPRPKPAIIKPWLGIVFIVVLLAGVGYFGWRWYSGNKATPNLGLNNIPKPIQANKDNALIAIAFNDNVDRLTAEKTLNQYGEKQNGTMISDLRQMIYVKSNKTGWIIFQGRIYDFQLGIKSDNVQGDVNSLSNNELFKIVEPYCVEPGANNPSCIHLSSKEDADYTAILSFIKSKGFEIQKESVNPIYASFYAPSDQQDQWLEKLKKDPNFKTVSFDYPV